MSREIRTPNFAKAGIYARDIERVGRKQSIPLPFGFAIGCKMAALTAVQRHIGWLLKERAFL